MIGEILLREATRWGLRLTRRGDTIFIVPAKLCPPEFVALVRQHKGAVLELLRAKADGLAADERPWLHVAKQVLAGEFDTADDSLRQSILIGLRSIPHPTCRAASDKLQVESRRAS